MPAAPLIWDVFCRVIDNHGDLGVCWRLARELAARGHQVRLWVDDASALDWMAPGALTGAVAGVQVLPWASACDASALLQRAPSDVWVEAFGCEITTEFIAASACQTSAEGQYGIENSADHVAASDGVTGPHPEGKGVQPAQSIALAPLGRERGEGRLSHAPHQEKPVWINLEYLSAESYVERAHALPSPVMSGPAAGWTKWFFYPGFTPRTGGLLRERDLPARQAAFDRAAWLRAQSIDWRGERLVSLFCYEPPALAALLHQLADSDEPTRLLVTAGRAAQAVEQVFSSEIGLQRSMDKRKQLSISYLPHLTQRAYDELLWACDLNFVRGEDSLVRALWAGAPFIWHIYPQPDDDAHHAKLHAFLDWLPAPPTLRQWHAIWNGVEQGALPPIDLPAWRDAVQAARARLLNQPELVDQLIAFVGQKR